eukprot:scaffold85837_cov63-Attheya_sp.AAC.2
MEGKETRATKEEGAKGPSRGQRRHETHCNAGPKDHARARGKKCGNGMKVSGQGPHEEQGPACHAGATTCTTGDYMMQTATQSHLSPCRHSRQRRPHESPHQYLVHITVIVIAIVVQ